MRIPFKYSNFKTNTFQSISLCLIAKNEAKRLRRCIASVMDLVQEIILVDTGSTDDTCKISRELGIKTLHFDWNDDFSAPRNYGISKATCDWILILDPDETLNARDHFRIKQLTTHPIAQAFQLTTRNYSHNIKESGARRCVGEYPEEKGFPCYNPSTKGRLFKNGLGIVFTGCWHELIDYYVHKNKIPCLLSSVPVHHWTHEICQSNIKEKRAFYLKLGEKKVKENPQDYQAWYELGVSEAICGLRHRAAYSFGMALKGRKPDSKALFTLSRVYNLLDDKKKGSYCFEKAICTIYPALTHINPDLKAFDSLIPT